MELTDENIVKKILDGDHEAFGLLMSRYQSKLEYYGRKFISDKDDVHDLIQDIFIKAYTNLRSFDIKRNFSSWIYSIAHNVFVNAIRDGAKNRLNFSLFDADVLFPHPISNDNADDKTKRDEIKNMFDSYLSDIVPKYREPFVLYYYQELEYKEISDILKVPVSTIASRVKRAKELLRKSMEKSVLFNE